MNNFTSSSQNEIDFSISKTEISELPFQNETQPKQTFHNPTESNPLNYSADLSDLLVLSKSQSQNQICFPSNTQNKVKETINDEDLSVSFSDISDNEMNTMNRKDIHNGTTGNYPDNSCTPSLCNYYDITPITNKLVIQNNNNTYGEGVAIKGVNLNVVYGNMTNNMVNDGYCNSNNKEVCDWDELIMIKSQSLSSRKTPIKYTKAQLNCGNSKEHCNVNNIECEGRKNLMEKFILSERNFNLNESENEEEINLCNKERKVKECMQDKVDDNVNKNNGNIFVVQHNTTFDIIHINKKDTCDKKDNNNLQICSEHTNINSNNNSVYHCSTISFNLPKTEQSNIQTQPLTNTKNNNCIQNFTTPHEHKFNMTSPPFINKTTKSTKPIITTPSSITSKNNYTNLNSHLIKRTISNPNSKHPTKRMISHHTNNKTNLSFNNSNRSLSSKRKTNSKNKSISHSHSKSKQPQDLNALFAKQTLQTPKSKDNINITNKKKSNTNIIKKFTSETTTTLLKQFKKSGTLNGCYENKVVNMNVLKSPNNNNSISNTNNKANRISSTTNKSKSRSKSKSKSKTNHKQRKTYINLQSILSKFDSTSSHDKTKKKSLYNFNSIFNVKETHSLQLTNLISNTSKQNVNNINNKILPTQETVNTTTNNNYTAMNTTMSSVKKSPKVIQDFSFYKKKKNMYSGHFIPRNSCDGCSCDDSNNKSIKINNKEDFLSAKKNLIESSIKLNKLNGDEEEPIYQE